MNKGFAWVPVLVTFMVAGVAALSILYFVGQANEETANRTNETLAANITYEAGANTNASVNASVSTADWETYTNSTYHFTFRYPASWTIDDNEGTYTDGMPYWNVKATDPTGKDGSFIVSPISSAVLMQDGEWDERLTNVTIDEHPAQKIVYSPKAGQTWAVREPADRAGFTFPTAPTAWENTPRTIAWILGSDNTTNAVDAILSTFQFID